MKTTDVHHQDDLALIDKEVHVNTIDVKHVFYRDNVVSL